MIFFVVNLRNRNTLRTQTEKTSYRKFTSQRIAPTFMSEKNQCASSTVDSNRERKIPSGVSAVFVVFGCLAVLHWCAPTLSISPLVLRGM